MNTPIQISLEGPRRNLLTSSFSRSTSALTLITLAFACFALLPVTQAVFPPPDGGYGNFNTAEGSDALSSLTAGSKNTAIGYRALFSNTVGNYNTATGSEALVSNTTGGENTATGDGALFENTTGSFNTANG